MIYCEGKFISFSEKENKGFKFGQLLVENKDSAYPHILKTRTGQDYKQYLDKNGVIKCPLYIDSYDSRVKKFNPKGVNLNLAFDKKVSKA